MKVCFFLFFFFFVYILQKIEFNVFSQKKIIEQNLPKRLTKECENIGKIMADMVLMVCWPNIQRFQNHFGMIISEIALPFKLATQESKNILVEQDKDIVFG